MHRILIADDHALVLSGIELELQKRSDCNLVFKANSGKEAWQAIKTHRPSHAILDIRMGEMTGIDIAQKILDEKLPISVVLLTMYHDYEFIQRARQLGVSGYLLKDSVATELHLCLDAIFAGDTYLSRSLKQIEAEIINKQDESQVLSRMEKKVFRLIGEGKTNKEIADLLFLSPKTIDNHRYNMTKKLGLSGSNALLIAAVKNLEKPSR